MPALGPERRLTAAQQNGSYSRVQQTCLQGVATAAFDPTRNQRKSHFALHHCSPLPKADLSPCSIAQASEDR